MGFKSPAEFLKALTMGALGVHHIAAYLRAAGFRPIELERFSASNKIWQTKIKRARLPDLMCVNTGLRIEVKAKTSLALELSHSEANEDRHWDEGLGDRDLIAFTVYQACGGTPRMVGAEFFSVAALKAVEMAGRLSGPKAASQGAERRLKWRASVSKRPGIVTRITDKSLQIRCGGDGEPEGWVSFPMEGKHPYVRLNEVVEPDIMFIAGEPAQKANLDDYRGVEYNPINYLFSEDYVSKFAAARAIPFRPDTFQDAAVWLRRAILETTDQRLKLEMAGAAAYLDMDGAEDSIFREALKPDSVKESQQMKMEAVLVLSELACRLRRPSLLQRLSAICGGMGDNMSGEMRAAAVWGLGLAKAYDLVVPIRLTQTPTTSCGVATYPLDAHRRQV